MANATELKKWNEMFIFEIAFPFFFNPKILESFANHG